MIEIYYNAQPIETHEGNTVEQAVKILNTWSHHGKRIEVKYHQGKRYIYVDDTFKSWDSGSLEFSSIYAVITPERQ